MHKLLYAKISVFRGTKLFFHFLGLYASRLKETYDIGRNISKNGEYEEIDYCEELMLECTMNMLLTFCALE